MTRRLLCVGLLSIAAPVWAAPSASEIMARAEETAQTDDLTAMATLTTGGGGSAERIKQFTWWRKLREDRKHHSTLTRFQTPAEIRGEGILFLERSNNDNEVLIYLPAFKKIRRVESQQQSGSFMGSELSYSDVATAHVDDYRHKLLEIVSCAAPGNAAASCAVVESVPANEAVRERTGYSRTVSWVRQDIFVAPKREYYGLDGKLTKRVEASDITEVDPARHKWMALRIRIQNLANQKFTLLEFAKVKVNQGLSDQIFTQQSLSREQ